MPNQPKTPIKCFRIPERSYQAARHRATLEGTTLSDVVRAFVETYADEASDAIKAHSCQHKAYRMTCAEYDALLIEADGKCQHCGKRSDALVIDHDHRFDFTAVRGLVCPSCNTKLTKVDEGKVRDIEPRTARYLANAWHLHKVAKS